jgi:hypothetical protein
MSLIEEEKVLEGEDEEDNDSSYKRFTPVVMVVTQKMKKD